MLSIHNFFQVTLAHGRTARVGHGLPKVSLGLTIASPSTPPFYGHPHRARGQQVPCGRLLTFCTPHAIRLCLDHSVALELPNTHPIPTTRRETSFFHSMLYTLSLRNSLLLIHLSGFRLLPASGASCLSCDSSVPRGLKGGVVVRDGVPSKLRDAIPPAPASGADVRAVGRVLRAKPKREKKLTDVRKGSSFRLLN
jgi:hypothetical protein